MGEETSADNEGAHFGYNGFRGNPMNIYGLQKVPPISLLGTFRFVLLFIVLLTLIGRLLVLTEYAPEIRKGPIVSSPGVAVSARHLMVHFFWNEMWGENPPRVFVTVTRHGQIYVDGKIVIPELLRDALRESQNRSDIPSCIYLDADKSLPYGEVQKVLKVANSLGFYHYQLVVRF
jgi:biopolymer transport protein ExbD